MSILLTVIAFAAVMGGAEINRAFVFILLITMAVVQVIIQLAFWMHMKDRGHVYAITGIAFGFIIALTGLAAVVYWIWW